MASPFNVFRKHQKVVIVAAGVLCMFVFVIGDVLFQLVPQGGAGGSGSEYDFDDVAVRWDNGELTLGEVQNLVAQRSILRHFLRTALTAGIQATGTAPNVREIMPLDRAEESPQQMAVYRHLMAEAARDAGMVVSDAAINQYLAQLTQGQVSSEELRAIASRLQANNRRVGMTFIFEALRQEMLAEAYWNSHLPIVLTSTPHQRWEDWRKFNDRIVIESLAVPVGDFVGEVPDPSDEELREFYEQYKDREPTNVFVPPYTELPSPDTGFRIPRRVEVHYLEANYESLVRQIANELTEEEVREYYEENRETYIQPRFDTGIDNASGSGAVTEEPATDGAEEAATVPAAPEGEAATPAESEAGDTAPPETDTEPESSTEPKPDAEPEPDAESESGQVSDKPSQSSQLLIPAAEPTQYVAFLQDEQPAPQEEQPEATAAPAEGAEDSAAAEQEASPSPADSEGLPPEPADEPLAQETEVAPETETPDAQQPATEEVEYLPLEAVEQEIRETIADDRVPERLQEIMPLVYSELTRVYREYEDRRLDAEELGEDPAQVEPPSYNLDQLAEKYGLEAKQTPLLSQLELQKTDVGESTVQQAAVPYWMFAFEQQPLYQPVQTGLTVSAFEQTLGRFNEYVAIKMDDRPSRTPPLDEIRDEVVRAYKRVKARDLAMSAAEELAEKARSAGEPLQELFAADENHPVVESDPFSWYTDSFQQLFHLSKPYGVEHAGPEFMEKVVSLEPGEVAAVWNHDHSVAYVVRLDRHLLSEDALRDTFLREVNRSQVLQKADSYRSRHLFQMLFASIREDANVEWLIPPDQRRQDT